MMLGTVFELKNFLLETKDDLMISINLTVIIMCHQWLFKNPVKDKWRSPCYSFNGTNIHS